MKTFCITLFAFAAYSSAAAQSLPITTTAHGSDTLKATPVEVMKAPIITDEETNAPNEDYIKSTFNGKDVYIKQENQMTIIYVPE
jgi:hypothetical protein